jgi:dTDP-4-amino-4,6-dideoxygalactose transaminase
MRVPLLDLKPQYQSLKDELAPILQSVLESQAFVMGAEVEGFEQEMAAYLGTPHAIGCASGTDALLLPLMAMNPQPGDEVILPTFTFFATAGAVWNAGFRPVFCDVDPRTFNVTRALLEAAWTPRTRGVIPVHLFGQMAPMAEILDLAREREAFVLEDAAQAVGARQRVEGPQGASWASAGTVGDAGAFSFFPSKNLGAFGDGGLVSAREPGLADRVAKLRVHGGRQMYHHEMVGTNSRLDALQAAILRVKLRHLGRWEEARRQNACHYHGGLAGVSALQLPEVLEGNHHVFNQYTVRVSERDALREFLSERGIGTGVYYPVPLHLQPCFEGLGGRPGQCPVAEQACQEVLSLPIFPELGEDRLARVVEEIQTFFRG